ncbi:MAG: sialate O-acetylesterase [Rikenellaceae bacterium]
MNYKMQKLLTFAFAILTILTAQGKVRLSPLFSDNMILQQLTEAQIWGETTIKNGDITITPSWSSTAITTKANGRGEWKTTISTPSYGGPYTISISDGEADVTIENVLIGEVWIASGQSNMARTLAGMKDQYIENSVIDIAKSRDSKLRIMSIRRGGATDPQTKVLSQGWQEASSSVVRGTSATAYYFARMLRECLDIPVGIIVSAVGGTSINCWISNEIAAKYEDVVNHDEHYPHPDTRHSSVLYNAMIHPIAGYSSKGFIWYQGESDIVNYSSYSQKMVDLVDLWRKKWGDDSMAFYYAQIAPFDYEKEIAPGWKSHYIREAQLKAVDMIPNSGMAVLSDAGDKNNIHPSCKTIPGERLALQALEKSYFFEGVESDGPTIKSVEIIGSEMVITFDNTKIGVITHNNEEVKDFEIAGDNGEFVKADARIEKGVVIVSAKSVKEPKYIRYGFKNWFKGTLYNVEGIPASSFRTDEFKH